MIKIDIDPAKVRSVYSGKHGCACGCVGNHSENPRTIKLIVGKVLKFAAEGNEVNVSINGLNNYISADTDTRSYIVYI